MDKQKQKELITEIMEADAKDGLYKQKTAVEWLQELYNSRPAYEEFIMDDEFEKAKAMEKEQIISAWLSGENDGSLEPKAFVDIAEQYYNETFNK